MTKREFYKIFIPALIKALDNEEKFCSFHIKDPVSYLNLSEKEMKEIDLYLDETSGKDSFLDKVGYYFDAKSHNFPSIQGVLINDYKIDLLKEIDKYIQLYKID